MGLRALSVLAAAVAVATCGGSALAWQKADEDVRVESGVVIIERHETPDRRVPGVVGVYVGGGLVVTAHHCMEGCTDAFVQMGRLGRWHIAGVVADDPRIDITVLTASIPPNQALNPLSWSAAPVEPGDAVYQVWRRDGEYGRSIWEFGKVLEISAGGRVRPPRVYTDAIGEMGCSGSPLFDCGGGVAGIMVECDRESGFMRAVPASSILGMPRHPIQPLAEWWAGQDGADGPELRHALILGQSEVMGQRWEEGVQTLRHAVELNPGCLRAWELFEDALWPLGRESEGVSLAVQKLKDSPGDPVILHALGRARAWAYAADSGLDAYQDSARASPSVEVYRELGRILVAIRRWKEATDAYESALALDPADAELWVSLGDCRERSGDSTGADEAYQKAIAADPWCAEAHKLRGERLYGSKRVEEALAEAVAYTRCRPGDAAGHCRRGTLLVELKRFDEAIGPLQRAAGMAPEDDDAIWQLALAYAATHQPEAAEAEVSKLEARSELLGRRLRAAVREQAQSGEPTGR
jgi:tetratricopeptide (TPR) repeat protein